MGLLDGFLSLGQNINKTDDTSTEELEQGLDGESVSEFSLDISDEDLISLKNAWNSKWEKKSSKLKERQKRNERWYLGNAYGDWTDASVDRPLADNSLFDAFETYIPLATRQNPEPLVLCEGSEEGRVLADSVKKMLAYLSDTLGLKYQLKQVVRHWGLYLHGCVKVGWDAEKDDISLQVVRPQRLILDPDAPVVNGVYQGKYIGEVRKDTAKTLMDRFPKAKDVILETIGDKSKMGSEVRYEEWWTNEYVFWSLKDKVLGKARNPHWNWDQQVKVFDENGEESEETERGNNHFSVPQTPYTFLTVANLGKHPWDDTTAMEQAIALQEIIYKRVRQIDRNADSTNGAIAISGNAFTKEQSAGVDSAVRKGGTIYLPGVQNVGEAVQRVGAPALPGFVYDSLVDARVRLQETFGVRGSTSSGIQGEKTVRGKILQGTRDTDRIGGGVTEALEQVADRVYNWWVQLMFVYYDEEHVAAVIGEGEAGEYVAVRSTDFNKKIAVSVKEGSLLPKDSLTRRNEAIDLWTAGALAPSDLYKRLEDPNPAETEQNLLAYQTGQIAQQSGQVAPGGDVIPEGQQEVTDQQAQAVPMLNQVPIQ